MGASFLAGGLYLQNNHAAPDCKWAYMKYGRNSLMYISVPTVMGVFAVSAIFSEVGNGANFSLVPHCNSYNNVGSLKLNTGSPSPDRCFVGCHVGHCRRFWQPGWPHLCPHFQIPDCHWEGVLDCRCHVRRCQYSSARCSSTQLVELLILSVWRSDTPKVLSLSQLL